MILTAIGGYVSNEYNITFYMLKDYTYPDRRDISPWVELVKKTIEDYRGKEGYLRCIRGDMDRPTSWPILAKVKFKE